MQCNIHINVYGKTILSKIIDFKIFIKQFNLYKEGLIYENNRKKRKFFWEKFTESFYDQMKNKFCEGPKPFHEANETILERSRFQLYSFLDWYLLPVIVDYINRNRKSTIQTENSSLLYDSFFANGFNGSIEILEKNYSETLSTIFDRFRLFRSHFTQTCDRIFSDWEEIKNSFNITDNDSINNIRFFTGDVHGSGGQTTIIIFNDGEKGFVYKPVDLSIIQFFYYLFEYIKNTLNLSFKKIPSIILKENTGFNNYGYINFIPYKGNVENYEDAQKVYTNFGKILAFARFLM